MKKIICSFIIFVAIALSQSSINAQILPGGYWSGIEYCNFDNPCMSVHLDTLISSNIWRVGLTNKVEFLPASNAVVTDLTNPYPVSNDSYFDIYINNLSWSHINPIIGFDHKYSTDSLSDGGYIELSSDNGLTWKNVIDDSTMFHNFGCNGRLNFYSHNDTIKGKIPAFTGSSNGWIHSEIQWVWWIMTKSTFDMTPPDTLILRFHFKSDNIQNNKPGWIIDNLNISNCVLGDVNDISFKNNLLNVFPNPLTSTARISFLKELSLINSVRVFDLPGNCVFEENNVKSNNFLFNKGNLHAGLYFLRVEDTKGNVFLKKIILN